MFDVKARIVDSENNTIGYKLTDRKEDIIVNLEQFTRLAKEKLVYRVVYISYSKKTIGIDGLDLNRVEIESRKTDDKSTHEQLEKVKIKYKVVRYRTSLILNMFRFEHLDYIQKKYFVNELVKLENKQILKSIQALEKLTNNYSDETCTDIQPFIDKYRAKFETIGYYIENSSKETLLIRKNSKVKYRKLLPNGRMYINNKEMQALCKKYGLSKERMTTRVDDIMMSIEHTTPNKIVETLSHSLRKQLISDKKYRQVKDTIAKEILREEDYKVYKQTGGCW